jgi:hypothetical protein
MLDVEFGLESDCGVEWVWNQELREKAGSD